LIPFSFIVESALAPAAVRENLSKRCREYRWPPTIDSRTVGAPGKPRITGGPDHFRIWVWPGASRRLTVVLDCRTTPNASGGCTIRVRARASRTEWAGMLVAGGCLAILSAATGGDMTALAILIVAGAAFAAFDLFSDETAKRAATLRALLEEAAKAAVPSQPDLLTRSPDATTAARRRTTRAR
jgi:hypothetical protein